MTDEKQADAERLDLVEEYAQALVGVLTSDSLLAHVPVVKTITAFVKAVGSVRDQILIQKMARFVEALSEITPAQKQEMVRRLEADASYNRKVGLHLIEVLDRIDSHRKPAMLGYCFLAYAEGKILDAVQLQRLVSAIERLPTAEIDSVRGFLSTRNNQPERDRMHPESIQALNNAGLVQWAQASPIGGRVSYRENQTCVLFVELNLDVRSTN